ncbi:DUF2971 domain-containing protein [Methanosphaera sp. ISO3-F5]|uniref:DUF2971 domain-containing protein n=1 Tax=Methanosphaera sp. ISO3-F5 TaxID=1452353 RepID=UPI002B25D14B|nr:DUF2971 domain-containing protein [Methanosphaera sp. ISO3-F5]WQH65153.1 hypothetical protein PXD04_05060 [Methanosphaera sp. ISO3-F5]
MLDNSLNKQWKIDFFKVFATEYDNIQVFEKADKKKFEHFPPVIGNFYEKTVSPEELKNICEGKLKIKKAKLDENYNDIVKIDYLKNIKSQLNNVMHQQIMNLQQEDPTFLSEEEKEIIENADFPFAKLMTVVFSKDTDEMTVEDQQEWKTNMNQFINQQFISGIINIYFTMKLYKDNNYVRLFQTPYNKKELWDEYAGNHKGFCVAYDFKQIKRTNAMNLNRLFPVLYVKEKISEDELDYDVYNYHCASIMKVRNEVTDYDNEWMFIYNHHYTETEYRMLDNLLEPIYHKTMNNPKIQQITFKNYLKEENDELIYKHEDIINDILKILESEEFDSQIHDEFEEVLKITDDEIMFDYMKPEAIYLGIKFPEEKIESYKNIVESTGTRIFQIKEKDGKIFKSII